MSVTILKRKQRLFAAEELAGQSVAEWLDNLSTPNDNYTIIYEVYLEKIVALPSGGIFVLALVEQTIFTEWNDTLTPREQNEIHAYIASRVQGIDPNIDALPKWLADLEIARRENLQLREASHD